MVSESEMKRVISLIDKEELANLAVSLAAIYSPPEEEGKVAQFVVDWLKNEGIETKLIAAIPERPNVVGTLRGTGGGYSLLICSHMDVAPALPELVNNPKERRMIDAWREGNKLYGQGIINCKGPMACFLMAAKAIKNSGIKLKGDLLLTAVPGEIGWNPVDEFQAPRFLDKEYGARYLIETRRLYRLCAHC